MKNKITTLALLFSVFGTWAQVPMEVLRTKAVDRYTPVTNIHVDADGNKWVGNRKGVFQVFSAEQAANLDVAPNEWSLLQTPSGNKDIRLPLDELLTQMGDDGESIRVKDDRITAAIFEEKGAQLWVGTRKSGLFQFKTQPALKLVQRHHPGNSKLGSSEINKLFLDQDGRLWIGTTEGCTYGKDGKWQQEESVFSIKAFAQSGTDVWIMGDDLLWRVDARNNWIPVDIDENLTEGEVVDIAVDGQGMLWVASQIITRFDPSTEESKVFGPADEFTSQDVACMAIDKENAVWIGTNDKGLYLIQKADAMVVTCLVDKPVSCGTNKKDGALKVMVSGGVAPYSYNWDGGLTGPNPEGLGPGEYSLTVTDNNGKSKATKAVVPDPNISYNKLTQTPATPDGGANGSASILPKGGVEPYNFKWDNGETSATATKLDEGTHMVTVTDKTGCTASFSVEIKRTLAALSVSISQTKAVGCAGAKDAAIKAEASGGKAPYQYQWNNPSLMAGANLTGLAAGTYALTLTDATGQSATASFEVKDATPVNATAKVDAPASTGNSDGKATAKAAGGTGGFSYKWDTGEPSATAVKLGPGQHTVTVTDAAGCSATATVNVSENVLPMTVTILQKAEIKCAGEKSAELQTKVSGGKEPFKYAWDLPGSSSGQPTSLTAGNYALTVTDATGQTAAASIEVKEPKAISLTAKVDAPASTGNADGKATAKATGGTGSLSYKWDTGEPSATAVKLGPGQHTVTVTDANGCSATTSVNVTENILPLSVRIAEGQALKCAGEKTASLKTEVDGGKGPFRFAWTGGLQGEAPLGLGAGTYEVTVTDATGATATSKFVVKEVPAINLTTKVDAPASTGNSDGKATAKATGGAGGFSYKWDTGEPSATAVKLGPGQHTVSVTDANGCTATASLGITENILPLQVSIDQSKEIKCAGEGGVTLQVKIEGGKEPFDISWSNGSRTREANGVSVGNFSVTITDATGKSATATKQVTEPPALKLNVVKIKPATTEKTQNGRATAEVTGGKGAHTIAWDNGESVVNAVALPAGQHTVTVTDANGCTTTASFEVKTRIIPELSANNLRSGETIKLEKIYFQPDSTKMEETSRPTLDELYEFLVENPGIVIEVGGHTNNIPSHEFCDQLSTERAKNVAQYLVDKGLPTTRITYKGYGKRNPVATNQTPEGRAKNQRVEMKVVKVN